MKIVLDGKPIPVDSRASKDVLLALKGLAKALKWRIAYDAAKESVYIGSQPHQPLIPSDRIPAAEPVAESARLAGKTICVDAGHGGADPGALGPSGTLEKDNTLAIAALLAHKLEQHGASVFLTRTTDAKVSHPEATAMQELRARTELANSTSADIFLSIHNDSFSDSQVSGSGTFHYGEPDGVRLAQALQKSLVSVLGTKDRGARFASFYTIRFTEMPAVLVETAFISNPEEELLLASPEGRENIASALFDGILQYFRV